jgi:hypothetical protein
LVYDKKGKIMDKAEYRAYTLTFMYFSEEAIAGIIKFHPEETNKIKNVLADTSWEKVTAFLNFKKDSLIDIPYKEILKKNLFEANELMHWQQDHTYEPKKYPPSDDDDSNITIEKK